MRKTPGRHIVKKHKREGSPVRSYRRGKGKLSKRDVLRARGDELFIKSLSRSRSRREPRNARTLKASKKFRVDRRTADYVATLDIRSPPQPKTIHVDRLGVKWDKERDLKLMNKRILDPTNPQHLALWKKDPGQYDLADVDTPFRDDDEITLFRGIAGQYYKREPERRLLKSYNTHVKGVGLCWTGNINVARIYAVHSTAGITTTIADVKTPKWGLAGLDRGIVEKIKYRKWDVSPPYYGVLFKYQAKGREIAVYNPAMLPFEMEGRMQKFHYPRDEWPLFRKYPGLEMGFVQESGNIAWHKVKKHHENMTLLEISKEKPYKTEKVKPLKLVKSDITNKYYVTGRSSGSVKVATKPSEKVEGK